MVIVLVARCSELKISEANVSGRARFLLELMLLLDKTGSSGVAQILVKFRNKKFQDKVLGEGFGEAYVESYWLRLSSSIFLSFSFSLLFIPSCPAIHACLYSPSLTPGISAYLCVSQYILYARCLAIESQIQ